MQTTSVRQETPSCFARDWDKDAPECAGGKDATYTNPRTGLNVREPCSFFSSCGARVQASRMAASGVIPASHLVRPPILTPPPTPPASMGDYLRQRQAEFAAVEQARGLPYMRPPIPAPGPQPYPQQQVHHPGQVWNLNYGMPGYLSVPEERMDGEGLKSVLLREVIRGVFKAIGHVLAHFFDSRRIKEKN
jgi:hypothetical protein